MFANQGIMMPLRSKNSPLPGSGSIEIPKVGASPIFRLAAEIVALAYIAAIAEIASATGAFYVMFPELGALSHDVFTRPRGRWAQAPMLLAVTPVLTGIIGIFFTRELPYGYVSVLLTVTRSYQEL